jgi:hypothetical protein
MMASLVPIKYRFNFIKDEELGGRVKEVEESTQNDEALLEMYGLLAEDCYMFGNDEMAIECSKNALQICGRLKGNLKSEYVKYTVEGILKALGYT